MYIENENTDTQQLFDADCMPDEYVVEFTDDGVANVRKDVGEALVANYSGITKSE